MERRTARQTMLIPVQMCSVQVSAITVGSLNLNCKFGTDIIIDGNSMLVMFI